MVNSSVSSHSISAQQRIEHILRSGRITASDRYWLHQVSTSDSMLSDSEIAQLRSIHDRLRMGLIHVIDA
ncbi:hypothetical protein [Leptolyngbya ohadii]|uniref:hypothetical protein n=1 Tax=Leptolyngbya ohadii TaxID=1962290 RepID=UPI000B5996F7|nr:hypothetical protein [Leptolyngbya ohadii]